MKFKKLSKSPLALTLLMSYALLLTFSAFHYHRVSLVSPEAVQSADSAGGHTALYSDISNCQLPRVNQNLSIYYAPAQISDNTQYADEGLLPAYHVPAIVLPSVNSPSLRAPPCLS